MRIPLDIGSQQHLRNNKIPYLNKEKELEIKREEELKRKPGR